MAWVYTPAVMRFIKSLAALQGVGLVDLPKMVVYWRKGHHLDPAGVESGCITPSPPLPLSPTVHATVKCSCSWFTKTEGLKCLEISTETKSILFATYLVLARWSPMISISFFLPSDLYERFFSCRLSYSRARAVHVHVSIVLFLGSQHDLTNLGVGEPWQRKTLRET